MGKKGREVVLPKTPPPAQQPTIERDLTNTSERDLTNANHTSEEQEG